MIQLPTYAGYSSSFLILWYKPKCSSLLEFHPIFALQCLYHPLRCCFSIALHLICEPPRNAHFFPYPPCFYQILTLTFSTVSNWSYVPRLQDILVHMLKQCCLEIFLIGMLQSDHIHRTAFYPSFSNVACNVFPLVGPQLRCIYQY